MNSMYYHMYDITFVELPNETSLTFSITGCELKCKGCHSPHIQSRSGHRLDISAFDRIFIQYYHYITAVCFLGGDKEPFMPSLLSYIKETYPSIKLGLYSGYTSVSHNIQSNLDYLKTGPYIEKKGALGSEYTNQRMHKLINGTWYDITNTFCDTVNDSVKYGSLYDIHSDTNIPMEMQLSYT